MADVMVVGLRVQSSVNDVFVGVEQWQIGCDGITGVFTATLGDADKTVHSTSDSTAHSHVIVACKTDSKLRIITQITCYRLSEKTASNSHWRISDYIFHMELIKSLADWIDTNGVSV